jgi:hypothetical protein
MIPRRDASLSNMGAPGVVQFKPVKGSSGGGTSDARVYVPAKPTAAINPVKISMRRVHARRAAAARMSAIAAQHGL